MIGVIIVNPESLDSVDDLRDALGRTNVALMQAAHELAMTNGALATTLAKLAQLAAHRHHGNTDVIDAILDEMLAEYFESSTAHSTRVCH